MAKVNSLISQRLKQAGEKFSKIVNLGELSTSGNLSSFSGVFRVSALSEDEKEKLKALLLAYKEEEQEIKQDLSSLITLTSEVKAINNQAAILHGERIKKAQDLLKKYRDGAFSAWLVATYGNRQTPYNFLQYYELYRTLPKTLHNKLEEMPRQAVYTLASRNGSFEKKEEIIKNYKGQPKQQLLLTIRETFPLAKEDKRAYDMGEYAIASLRRLSGVLNGAAFSPTDAQKKTLKLLLQSLHSHLK